ncbi:lymphotoxin-beta-like isoform X2 [Eleutherodactylus coqui]|uniref:lymphotoxin-beta-like isoform X2 n=1 Tax=Eleutherodactylus coqui TaxID=57060 RepID=UPI00346372A5
MTANWIQLLPFLMALVPLSVPAAEAKKQSSLKPGGKANQRSNWQKQNHRKPAAHLIGKNPSLKNTLSWMSEAEVAFTRKIKLPTNTTIVTPREGLYYVYCQIGFEGSDTNLTLLSQVITWHDSINENVTLVLGTESVAGPSLPRQTWRASLTLGSLANLQKGERLYVHVSHPELVDYTEGKTFFGIVLVS